MNTSMLNVVYTRSHVCLNVYTHLWLLPSVLWWMNTASVRWETPLGANCLALMGAGTVTSVAKSLKKSVCLGKSNWVFCRTWGGWKRGIARELLVGFSLLLLFEARTGVLLHVLEGWEVNGIICQSASISSDIFRVSPGWFSCACRWWLAWRFADQFVKASLLYNC